MRFAAVSALVLAIGACRHADVARPSAKAAAEPAPISAVVPYVATELAIDERAALGAGAFPDGAVGYLLLDPVSSEIIAERNASQTFPPGSVAKLATVVAALEVLGPQHRFATSIVHTGLIREGIVQGDLVLHGGGDPLLSVAELGGLVDRLRAAGVRAVRGRFLYDESLYAPAQRIEPGQEDDAAYDPGVGALALGGNVVRARWSAAERGAVQAWVVPQGAVEIGLSPAPTVGKIVRGPGPGEPWLLSPDLPHRGDQKLPVWRPGEHAAHVFAALARARGIEMSVPQPGGVGEGAATLIAEHRSAPLVAIARTGLETSDNPLSEMLALAVARSRLGRAPTIFEAAAEVNAFWRQKGVEVALEDGSGLSARSRLSPRAAAAILLEARRLAGAPFFSLLPAAGLSGTLGRRLSAPDVALRAWAKTGTLSYAAGLAGHLFTRSGRELIFAAFVAEPALRDDARARPPTTRAAAEAAETLEDAWLARARSLQDSLVTLWIARH